MADTTNEKGKIKEVGNLPLFYYEIVAVKVNYSSPIFSIISFSFKFLIDDGIP